MTLSLLGFRELMVLAAQAFLALQAYRPVHQRSRIKMPVVSVNNVSLYFLHLLFF
jgi:hypothetical protein